jgi:hypothetical protein
VAGEAPGEEKARAAQEIRDRESARPQMSIRR